MTPKQRILSRTFLSKRTIDFVIINLPADRSAEISSPAREAFRTAYEVLSVWQDRLMEAEGCSFNEAKTALLRDVRIERTVVSDDPLSLRLTLHFRAFDPAPIHVGAWSAER